ncbi:DUF1456 family protein [Escherichia coli]|nr:DUF1456 family protein [Escherichia coli]
MLSNDILRSVRYILKANNNDLVRILALGNVEATAEQIAVWLRKEDEEGFQRCPDIVLSSFLNGLIYEKRGKDESAPALEPERRINNNIVLKKLRIAFSLKTDDILAILTEQQFLTGEYRNPRLFDVTMALCVEMLISGKLAKDDAEARAKLQAVLDNGKAAEVFGRMVAAQKGPTDFVENYAKYLPTAMLTKAVYADTEGFVSEMDTRALGMAVVAMGGGRRQASDTIDYSVGFTDMARLGDQVDGQRPLAVIHAKDENSWQDAAKAVKAAIKLADKAPESTPTVYRRISE